MKERYDLIAELGRGGMGIVYQAFDRETGDQVALKVVNPRLASEKMLADLKSEMLLARKITHKNICRTHELMRFGNLSVIAMEFVEGESLRAVLSRPQGIAVRTGLRWAGQICQALEEAHTQGVVHRDLKPENIIIDRDGNAKIMDFGLARAADSDETHTGTISGTPAYISPEQAEGKPADARSDIYSLGLILYELFSGRRAFAAESGAALMRKQIHETPAPLQQVDPSVPNYLQRIVHRCMEKDPAKRFRSVTELSAALAGGVPQVTADGLAAIPPELSRWNRSDAVLVAFALLALVYVLKTWDSVLPAAKMKIEVDAISARREAESLAKQWNFAVNGRAKAEKVYRSDDSDENLFPFYWRLRLMDGTGTFAMPSNGYVLVDRKGKIQELHDPVSDYVPVNYVPPSPEKRRETATQAVSLGCGSVPEKASVIENYGGRSGAGYSLVLRPQAPLNAPPVAEIEFVMAKVTRLRCYAAKQLIPWFSRSSFREFPVLVSPIIAFFQVYLAVWILILAVRFGIQQRHLSPRLWERLPLSAITAIAGVWFLSRTLLPQVGFAVLIVIAVATSGIFLVLIVDLEQDLIRRGASRIASFQRVVERRIAEPGVGLALVRGALCGLVLVAMGLLYFQLSQFALEASGLSKGTKLLTGLLASVPRPDPLGVASASFSPGVFLLASALFHGFVLGLLAPGFAGLELPGISLWSLASPWEKRWVLPWLSPLSLLLSHATAGMLAVVVLNLNYPGSHSPMFGFFVAPFVMSLPLGWAFRRFDALTVIFAVFTYIVWSQGVPLLVILSEVGNASIQAAFGVWLAIVLVGVGIGFREQLTELARSARQPG